MKLKPRLYLAAAVLITGSWVTLELRKWLYLLVLPVIEEMDPRLAVKLGGTDASEDYVSLSWHPENAFRRWAEQDSAAATAWLDQQLAAGKFKAVEGPMHRQNMVRKALEGALISALLQTKPSAATARLSALPGERLEWMFTLRPSSRPEHDEAYVRFIRANAPAKDASVLLCTSADRLMPAGGYQRVDHFITAMAATGEEKSFIALQVLRTATGHDSSMEEMDQAHAWALTQLGSQADEIMGKALAVSAGMGSGYNATAARALKYHEHSGNDRVLVSFLKHISKDWAVFSKPMIDQINDPELRQRTRDLPQFKSK